jgi:hypothetical protein
MKQFRKGRDSMVPIEAASEMVGDGGLGDAPAHERGSRPGAGKRMTKGTTRFRTPQFLRFPRLPRRDKQNQVRAR